MSDIGLMVPDMYEPPCRYNVTITVAREGARHPDPVRFAVAADRAAWRRSASIVSARSRHHHQSGHRLPALKRTFPCGLSVYRS